MCKYVKWVGPRRAHKVPPILYKVCRKNNVFLWPCPGSEIKSRSKWNVCCTSTVIVQLIDTKYVQICVAVGAESRTQSTTRHIKYAGKQSFFAIWNKVKVKKLKTCCTSTIFVQLIGIKCVQICEAVWAEWRTKYHPCYKKYTGKQSLFVTLSWIWNKIKVKMKGMWHIYNYCTNDWHPSSVCKYVKRFGPSRVKHTKYHPYSGRTDKRTDMNHMSPVWGIRPVWDKNVLIPILAQEKTISVVWYVMKIAPVGFSC